MKIVNSPQTKYLILYALIVTPIVISFFFIRRSSQRPVQLKLDSHSKGASAAPGEKTIPQNPAPPTQLSGKKNPEWLDETQPGYRGRVHQPKGTRTEYRPRQEGPGAYWSKESNAETSLNILFNWNGHTWDAYEVLGLPAGSSREKVFAAYERLMERGDEESLPFFQAAYDAIMKSRTTRF